jgi:ketosteroid isomerase-like protein
MKTLLQSLFTFLLIAILSLGLMQPAHAVFNDVDLLKQGVAAWEKGWSSGDTLFSMDRVDNLYVKSNNFLEFDTLSPAETVTQSYQGFQNLWEPTMQGATQVKTVVDDNIKINTDGKMGLTTFTFQTEFTDRQTGKKYAEHAHASMVWEKRDGRWVILHEHVSSPVRMS